MRSEKRANSRISKADARAYSSSGTSAYVACLVRCGTHCTYSATIHMPEQAGLCEEKTSPWCYLYATTRRRNDDLIEVRKSLGVDPHPPIDCGRHDVDPDSLGDRQHVPRHERLRLQNARNLRGPSAQSGSVPLSVHELRGGRGRFAWQSLAHRRVSYQTWAVPHRVE